MNDYSAVSAYQQSTARGASPIGLIISLYDTILRDFRAAHPELSAPLDHYLRLASDLRTELQKVHMRLFARRTELEAARTQLNADFRFVSALSSTRRKRAFRAQCPSASANLWRLSLSALSLAFALGRRHFAPACF